MGGGCHRIPNRITVIAGTQCENSCFPNHGGCKADNLDGVKQNETCEYAPEFQKSGLVTPIEEIIAKVKDATEHGESVFVYTPDMFSEIFFRDLFERLPVCTDERVYISINACVRTFLDRCNDWNLVKSKGIREVWFGVESAVHEIRENYNKLPFTNDELLALTKAAKEVGVNVCWYLVDSDLDTQETRLATYDLIKTGNPFRLNVEHGIR